MPERAPSGGFKVVAATLFGGIEVARYPTLEQAEWRARQLAAEAERSPSAARAQPARLRPVPGQAHRGAAGSKVKILG